MTIDTITKLYKYRKTEKLQNFNKTINFPYIEFSIAKKYIQIIKCSYIYSGLQGNKKNPSLYSQVYDVLKNS